MAILSYEYNELKKYLIARDIFIESDTLKLALLTNVYVPNLSTDKIWGDISTHEVATGAGYTTGGETLTGVTVTNTTNLKIDANDVTWTALTKTFRYGVIYANVTRNTFVNPLIACYLFDNTPADVVVSGTNWTVQWSASGILMVF